MLKAGTQTGSLTNHLLSRMTRGQPRVEIGMGATLLNWTDRHPATIIIVEGDGISAGTIITTQQDLATIKTGSAQDGSAEYDYTANPHGATYAFRLGKTGSWDNVTFNRTTNRWNKTDGMGLRIGQREKYHDPCF